MNGDDHTPDSRRAEFLADAFTNPPSSRSIMPSSRRMSVPAPPGSLNSIPPSSLSSLHKAIGALDKMKAKLDTIERRHAEPIAIVGMACRFPGGSDSPEAFFQALEAGVDAVTQVPEERWRLETTKEADASPEQRAVRWGAFLAEPVDRFDARFFGISPREAVHLDPQQRLLLEVGWEALERAGLDPTRLMGSLTGVFVGITTSDYADLCKAAGPEGEDAYSSTGNIHCFAPGRLSYTFGLQGPSLAVDTACSSSLVAVHLACQSLRTGEATLAIAGGVNLMLTPDTMRLTATTMGLSPDGRCKAFDASANGFVRSEGCGLIVLKRLSDALRDGDRILATIRGSAVNQDGRSTGMTAPNVLSQQAMLRQALASARVTAEEIGYVEAHGTGTSLGDPIEIEALRAVLGKARVDGTTCALGAVKTNVGHLEAAAGIAGLIKAVMVLQRETIPANLHFRKLNPRISLEGTPFVIPTENLPWVRGTKPRIAGVSAFGLSGTNAHVILEEAPREKVDESAESSTSYLLPISARSSEALRAFAADYAKMLSRSKGPRISDLVSTASLRRTHHEHRVAITGRTREEMAQALDFLGRNSAADGVAQRRVVRAGRPKVVFVFPGQGSQWFGMGRQLLAEEPAFRTALEHCDEVIRRQGDFSVIDELDAPEGHARLNEIQIVQPLLFAIEVALAALWRSWGIEPDAVVGHSMGEVAAARVAGILSLEDAAKVICRRSRILRRASGKGAMALVELGRTEAQMALAGYEDRLSVAVSNGPQSTVISGDPAALDEVLQALEKRDVFSRRVKVDVASHSPQMDPLKGDLLATLRNLRPRSGQIAMRSTVTGEPLRGPELDAAYWVKNLRDPVLFLDVTQRLIDEGHSIFVEMSPHPILLPSIEENLQEKQQDGVAIASMRRNTDERLTMLEALGVLYTRGHAVDWKRIYPHESRSVQLPAYPWQRERHWVQGPVVVKPKPAAHDLLDECVYNVKWRRKPRAIGPSDNVVAPSGGAWLLIGDRGGLAAALAAQLTSRGQVAVRVVPGKRFACVEPNLYEVNLANEDDYRALLEVAFGSGQRCRGVVHLSSLDATPWEHASVETLKLDQQIGFLSGLHTARAILRQSWPELPRLWLITRGAQTVANEPVLGTAQAPLWGLGRTLALEHPELECSLVDLESTQGAKGALDLLQELSAPDAEAQIALRSGDRYVARLVQSGFHAAPAPTFRFEEDASYLITGGLSGLGLSAAGWMVEQGARHLALLGRRAPTEETKAAIRAMEARGAEVLVFSADVAQRDDVDRVIEEVSRRMPRLRGLVHAAGIGQESTLLEAQTESSFWTVMAPKMIGAFHLHAATKGTPLDFFVLYSSASAALGLIGQAAYSGANACLDAMAHGLRDAGVPALSIQWGAFSEVGLAARDTTGERMNRGGLESLTPRQGNEALGRLLLETRAEVAVMRLALHRWFVIFPQLTNSPFWSELQQGDRGSQPRAPQSDERAIKSLRQALEATAPAERLQRLERHVQQELGKVLRLDPAQIGPTDPFRGYGFDSLMGLELRNLLQTTLGLQLSMADIVTHARIDQLAELLMQRFPLALGLPGSAAPAISPLEGNAAGESAKLPPPGSWIVTPRPSPAAKMRLFCFPYAGGSASLFGTWPAGLPSEIEVCAIQPPGRHERLHEPLLQSVEEMVAELVPALLPYLDRPFAMFGHCLGAIVMFEVLQELAEKQGLRPAHVFISGAPAPRKYAVPNTATRSPQEFIDLLEFIGFTRGSVLGDEDAERHLLPAVKADFEAAARYKHIPSVPLDTSITAFAGSEDVFAPPDVMNDWQAQTTSWFSKIVLPGEHYFIVPERAALLRIIGEELLLRLASLEQKQESSAMSSTTRGPRAPWLRTPAPRARPRARLFCFPGLGKSSSVYDRFPTLLGADVEVCMIDLPGRGARTHELPLGRVDELVDSLAPALQAHLDVPYAFFGVDIGAIVMFEAARRLRREGATPPGHLFASAAMAPQEYFWAPMHHLPRERLLRGLRTMGFSLNENEANEQALRAECAVMASYIYANELPLSIPLTAFWGERDSLCPRGSVPQWREQTTAAFAFHVWPGGHDVACDEASALLDVVREALGKPPFC